MVCEKVGKMTQIKMRHDNLVHALRLVVSACSSQSAAEPRYRALAGKKGMVECQCWGDIVAATSCRCRGLTLQLWQWMSWLRMRLPSRTLLRLPRQLGGLRRGRNRPSGRGSRRMCRIMLLCGLCLLRWRRAGAWARRRQSFSRLGDIAAESGRVPKGAFNVCVLGNEAAVGDSAYDMMGHGYGAWLVAVLVVQ